MIRIARLGLLVLVQLLLGSAGAQSNNSAPDKNDKEVLFSVGEKKVTLGEFKNRYKEVMGSLNAPTPELFMEDMIRYEVGLQEAKKRQIEKDPAVIERINQELYKGLVEQAISAKVRAIKVSDGELKAHYREYPEIRSSHILIQVRDGSNKDERETARKRAQEIYDEVRVSKRPFEELVKLYTDDSFSKATGGDIGWQTRLTLVPSYYNALMSMKVNEIKGLVETPYGYHIVKLTGRQSFEQANKEALRESVKTQKRQQLFDELFSGLKKNYDIKTNTSLLRN